MSAVDARSYGVVGPVEGDDDLAHECASHADPGNCDATCVTFCGQRMGPDWEPDWDCPESEWCVVCEAMATEAGR